MFEITTVPFSEIKDRIRPFAARIPEVWTGLSDPTETLSTDAKRPFVQLSTDEIPGDEVDEILGYAGIPASNGPIGLPMDLEPIELSDDVVLFSTTGLEAHLRQVDPDVVAAFERAGSMDAFAKARGEKMSAREYLIGGIEECIRHCRKYREALVITW